jgi:hypothetical protein
MITLFGRDQNTLALLARVYARSGQQVEARKLLAELDEKARHGYVSPYGLAYVHVALGEKDKAFDKLNKSYDERNSDMINLKVDPDFDLLRSDPRFVDLVRRMGL